MYKFFLLRELDCGVRSSFSTSAKLTVLRGVVRVAAWLRLMAARVMSCNWRPELERATLEEPLLELRGVKKRLKRFGVMGGGLLGFRAPNVAVDAGGGDDEKSSGVGSCSQLRGAQGEDMFQTTIYIQETASRRCKQAGHRKKILAATT